MAIAIHTELPEPYLVDTLVKCGYPHEAALVLANHVDPHTCAALTTVRNCPLDLAARIAAYDEVPTDYYGKRGF